MFSIIHLSLMSAASFGGLVVKQSFWAKHFIRIALTAAILLACAGCSSGGSSDPTGSDKIVLGYYAGDAPIVYKSVTSYSTYLNAVVAARYGIDSSCAVTGSLPNTELLPFDKANGIATYAGVVNSDGSGFNADLGHSALVTNKAAMLANLVALTKDDGFAGLNLDFENLYPADRNAYSQFVSELAEALHAGGFKLILSVAAKGLDDPTDDWSYPFDYEAIGKDADLLQLMTYDQNGPDWSGPGPIAGADWVEKCIVYPLRW
jgi:spore germination protein